MAVYTSIDDLQKAIMAEINKAMEDASKEIKETMQKEVDSFYSEGDPVMYERTGQLGKTPKVSPIKSTATESSFDAYLDTSYRYPAITYTYYDGSQTTSKRPTMTDVINLTNYGTTSSSVGYLHPALGKPGYWERSVKQMKKILNQNLKKHLR